MRLPRLPAILSYLALLGGICACLAAAPPEALSPAERAARKLDRQLIAAGDETVLLANLTHLCDVIGPRLTGSPALQRANEWTAAKMRSYGLANVRLEPWLLPEGWERGPAQARLVEPNNGRSISVASMGWRPGTRGKVQGEVVALAAQSTSDLTAYRGKLKGAIVLTGPPVKLLPLSDLERPTGPISRAFRTEGIYKQPFDQVRKFLRAREAFLAQEGAAAVLQDAGKPLGLLITTGGWQGKDRASATARVPTLFVAHNHYEMLHRLATRPGSPRPRLELEVSNRFVPGPLKVFNTIGEIRGKEKPDEYVIIGAHLDSWDLGQGATDNGTGSCVILETARILARSGVQPRRSIRFVLFTGEEQGLHGSRAYVEQHKDEMARTSVCIVHDTGTGRVVGIGAGGHPAVQDILRQDLSSLRDLGVTDFNSRSYPGSDHASFARAGVPGFMVVQQPAGYALSHHTQADTLDRVRPADLIQGARALAVTAMRLANRKDLLPRPRK